MSREIRRWGPLSFARCREILNGRPYRRLGPNTHLEALHPREDPDAYAVRLYSTDVIRFYRDGRVILSSGGHRSNLTFQRISALAPVHLSREGGKWWVGEQPFYDGMNVGEKGLKDFLLDDAAGGCPAAKAALADLEKDGAAGLAGERGRER